MKLQVRLVGVTGELMMPRNESANQKVGPTRFGPAGRSAGNSCRSALYLRLMERRSPSKKFVKGFWNLRQSMWCFAKPED